MVAPTNANTHTPPTSSHSSSSNPSHSKHLSSSSPNTTSFGAGGHTSTSNAMHVAAGVAGILAAPILPFVYVVKLAAVSMAEKAEQRRDVKSGKSTGKSDGKADDEEGERVGENGDAVVAQAVSGPEMMALPQKARLGR